MDYLHIIIAAVIITGFIAGIRLMQMPDTALWGNRLGAFCMLLAVLFILNRAGMLTDPLIWLIILAGGVPGIILGQRVKMIQMPQMVALFNGFGGGASALIAGLILTIEADNSLVFFWLTALLALALGTLTFTGSIVAALKLQGWITQKPVFLKGHGAYLGALLTGGLVMILAGTVIRDASVLAAMPLLVLVFALYGFLMAVRVGGADMPIVIAFFNSLSGIATAICGLVVENLFLAGVGSLVGVAGMILTRIMCRAMNRSLLTVLSGLKSSYGKRETSKEIPVAGEEDAQKTQFEEVLKTEINNSSEAGTELSAETEQESKEAPSEGGGADPLPEKSGETPGETRAEATGEPLADKTADTTAETAAEDASLTPEEKISALVSDIQKVIIVPGYGMAVAQAQQQVCGLIKALEERGKEVKIAIHAVAGRMPGHMNVLLAEAGVPYEQLYDMDVINPEFGDTDLVVVVGACDVINPAANTAEGSPIYGMPVLSVDLAKNIVVCNLDEKPGYSGVDNTLYGDPKVVALWGDAAETVPRVTALFNN